MSIADDKPVIGISCGDINGIGLEIIIKTFADHRMLEFCTPVIFATNKTLNFYRKSLPDLPFSFSALKDGMAPNPKQVNVYNCWDEEVTITPGQLNETGGKYAVISLKAAVQALKQGWIDGLVTAPFHKNNVQSADFSYTGHTPFLKEYFGANDVLMFMVADNMKVGLVTEHVSMNNMPAKITKEAILSKLQMMHQSLFKDFGINKPRIAVLGLNPHAGDEGLIGAEEKQIIEPAIAQCRQQKMLVFGPYSADAFFARSQHEKFDGVLAMYHDQGLIPFKSLAIGEGVNYTAGLSVIRTSPDHGTAFDIAGKGIADETSFRAAVFQCVDILNMRREIKSQYGNPLRKLSANMLKNAVDEAIVDPE